MGTPPCQAATLGLYLNGRTTSELVSTGDYIHVAARVCATYMPVIRYPCTASRESTLALIVSYAPKAGVRLTATSKA